MNSPFFIEDDKPPTVSPSSPAALLAATVTRLRFRLQYIRDNFSDGVAIRFALDAEDWEIDAAIINETSNATAHLRADKEIK